MAKRRIIPQTDHEKEKFCIAEIWRGYRKYQCSRKRGKGKGGLYCGIHAKKNPAVAGE